MRKKLPFFLSGVMLAVLLPFLCTALINGMDILITKHRPDLEELLPALLSRQISADYEPAAIEAQAVIARSNLYRWMEGKENMVEILQEICLEMDLDYLVFREPDSIYEKAVARTKGQVLLSDGKLKLTPWHALSSGTTRDGEEALHDPDYAYLKSVDSSADKSSPDFISSTYIAQQPNNVSFKIVEKEDSGYVKSLETDGKILAGEVFALGMGLTSSDFSIQRIGDQVRFLCKGRGHGLGFSQYGGNELAKEGKNWEEILKAYFPEMETGTYSA